MTHTKLNGAAQAEVLVPERTYEVHVVQPGDMPDVAKGTDELTDLANAERFAALHREDTCYVEELGGWLCYDGKRWAVDASRAHHYLHAVVRRMLLDAQEEERKAAALLGVAEEKGDEHEVSQAKWRLRQARERTAWAKHSQSARSMLSVLHVAESLLRRKPEDFDTDPWLLNVNNGTIDLHTGELLPHCFDDRITKLAPVDYGPDALCHSWQAFLDRVQPDRDVQCFLARLIGYGLTGVLKEHVFPIFNGYGGNGKGLFTETFTTILGTDYARAVDPDLLLQKGANLQHSTEKMVLRGLRLVPTDETDQGAHLSLATMKRLTGGGLITARYVRANNVTFSPTHKFIMMTNNRPIVTEASDAVWRRVFLVEWPAKLTYQEGCHWRAAIDLELPGVLAWAVRGCLEWQERGLTPPAPVRLVTDEYKATSDPFGEFINGRCVLDPDGRITRSELYSAYHQWAAGSSREDQGQGLKPLGARNFALRLRSLRGDDGRPLVVDRCVRTQDLMKRRRPEEGWKGIRLKTAEELDALLPPGEDDDQPTSSAVGT